jgi:hypothetical protein
MTSLPAREHVQDGPARIRRQRLPTGCRTLGKEETETFEYFLHAVCAAQPSTRLYVKLQPSSPFDWIAAGIKHRLTISSVACLDRVIYRRLAYTIENNKGLKNIYYRSNDG